MMSEDKSSRMGGVNKTVTNLVQEVGEEGADADYKNIYIRLIIIIIIIINICFSLHNF